MHQSTILAIASASLASAQTTASLTFWRPGWQNNPSSASKWGFDTATYPPYASVITSNPSTTIFALGCPTSAPTLSLGTTSESCTWTDDSATYTIIDATKHIAHETRSDPSVSVWWSCDYSPVKTVMDCAMQIDGNVNDDTNGTVEYEFPDRFGNIVNFVTAEIVTAGGFGGAHGGAQSTMSESTMAWYSSELPQTGLRTASGGPPAMTASQGSGSGAAPTASSTASKDAAASTGAAAGFGVDAVRLVGLVGAAALAAW
jgi:hypothetical protein